MCLHCQCFALIFPAPLHLYQSVSLNLCLSSLLKLMSYRSACLPCRCPMHVINLASIFRLVYNRPALHNKASVSFSFTFFSPVDTIVQMTTIFSTLIRQLMSPADTPSVPLSQPLQLKYITSYDSPPPPEQAAKICNDHKKKVFTHLGDSREWGANHTVFC